MQRNEKILVTGATGQQGGAVTRHLLAEGWRVRALVRNASTAAARTLARLGTEVVEGDLLAPASLVPALAGVDGVFAAVTNWEDGVAAEIRQGMNLTDAARRAEVRHFVYSSVGGADRRSGVPHFESKAVIERHVRDLGLPWTIVRPVFFMDNFLNVFRPTPQDDGTLELALALPPDRRLQLIAVDDIGGIVAQLFAHRAESLGLALEIAGDELTPGQIVAAMAVATGAAVRYVTLPLEAVRAFSEDVALQFRWLEEKGFEADLARVRALYPTTTFERWLQGSGRLVAPATAELRSA